MDPAALVATLAPLLDGALIATDFDGTLAPLQVDPEQSRPVPGTIEALTALTERGAQVAVITGRDAETVMRLGSLVDVPGIVVAGAYGAEVWRGGSLTTPDTPDAVLTLRKRLPEVLAAAGADPAIWIEDKRLALVVHARRATNPTAALTAVEGAVRDAAAEVGFEVHAGSGVLELRLAGFDKGGALDRLVRELSPTAVLFLGDDLGDVPGFDHLRVLRGAGLPAFSVGVESSGVTEAVAAADVRVPDADAAVALLTALASPTTP